MTPSAVVKGQSKESKSESLIYRDGPLSILPNVQAEWP
jgi:hypothetical protein